MSSKGRLIHGFKLKGVKIRNLKTNKKEIKTLFENKIY